MNYAIILAGGTGSRAGGLLPKQFQLIAGRRMFWWSVLAFRRFDPECRIILVVHPDFIDAFSDEEESTGIPLLKVPGGSSRIESVRNGLTRILSECPDGAGSDEVRVFIHDAARPLVTPELIARGAEMAGKGVGAIPVVALSDSIRRLTAEGSEAADRAAFVAVQTPQIFMLPDIAAAYDAVKEGRGLTDDASVAERFGLKIVTFSGDPANFKVTNPNDLKWNFNILRE